MKFGVMMLGEMLDDFLIEVEELFEESEDVLLNLEKEGDFDQSFNSVFRTFHIIKGATGMFGLTKLQEHFHFLEYLLKTKKVDGKMSEDLIDYFLSGIDIAEKIVTKEDVSFKYFDPDNISELAEVKDDTAISKSGVLENEDVIAKTAAPILSSNIKENLSREKEKRDVSQGNAGHVYIVDDEEDILDILTQILEVHNYHVTAFSNPFEAIKALKVGAPDLVLTDIKMPENTVLELMSEVNEFNHYLPFIVVSGYVTKEACLYALSKGVSGLLEKPFNTQVLMAQVNNAVDRYHGFKSFNKSIDLLIYQMEDFGESDNALEQEKNAFRDELSIILKHEKDCLISSNNNSVG